MRASMKSILAAAVLSATLGMSGCAEPAPQGRGIYLLMDTSGTYTQELRKAEQLINAILAKLDPGDSFAVARIDTGSFSEKDIVAKITFDDRPSQANQQKRRFRETIAKFIREVEPAGHTDITGGLLQAAEYLNEKNPGIKTVLIFSDLKEDLKKGYIRDIPLQLQGFEIVALNVTKLLSDNIDPREYMTRLEDWQRRVEDGGGGWRVLNDFDRLDRILTASR
jgi:VWA domain-containing protein